MKINVFYRHTCIANATKSDRPEWFSHRKCFDNFIRTVIKSPFSDRVNLYFLFDGTEQEMMRDDCFNLLKNNPCSMEVNIIPICGGSQRKAWRKCLSIVKSEVEKKHIGDDDIIYFLENDYVHTEDWLANLFELATSNIKWDYVTLYDHPDKYPEYCTHTDINKNKNIKSEIYFSGSIHWRTTPSTCATYLLNKKTFVKDYWILRNGIYDYKLFFILTNILKRKLISPMPSLSTHSMLSLLSPVINWESKINE